MKNLSTKFTRNQLFLLGLLVVLMSAFFVTCNLENPIMAKWWDEGRGEPVLPPTERSGVNFAVVFMDLNGGIQVGGEPDSGELGPFRVLYGNKIPRLRPVTHSNANLGFGGWEDERGILWDMDTRTVKPEDDDNKSGFITLKARWVQNFVTVKFNMNYEQLFPSYYDVNWKDDLKNPRTQTDERIYVPDQEIIPGGKIIEPPVMPTDGKYGLIGWFLLDGGRIDNQTELNSLLAVGGKWDFANNLVPGPGGSGSQPLNLYARWGSYTRTIHLQVNGGTRPNGQELTRVNFTVFTGLGGSPGGKIIDPGPLTREGYTFAGWFTDRGVEWNFATSLVNETDDWDETVTPPRLRNDVFTLHARWVPNIYFVTFNAAGGTPVPATQEIQHGNRVTQPPPNMTPPTAISGVEQAFDGWISSAGTRWDFNTDVVTRNITLTARWVDKTYTVRFHLGSPPDGLFNTTIPIPQNVVSGGKVVEPFMPAVPAGINRYSFLRWDYHDTDDNPSKIQETLWRDSLDPWDFSDPVTKDMNLYARWVPPEPDMVWVPKGSFVMGDSGVSGSPAAYHAYPTRRVTVDGFYISRYEVTEVNSPNNTIRSYATVMGTNPSQFSHNTNRPVERVSWYDAIEYCMKLTEQTLGGSGNNVYSMSNIVRTPISGTGSPGIPSITSADVTVTWNRTGYRLPTEAEWEYAARGGNGSPGNFVYSGSNSPDAVAWYNETVKTRPSGDQATQPVGSKQANALGIYDMSGNVSEWVWDWFDSYKNINPNGNPLTNPKGPESSPDGTRVRRGGSWSNAASNVRNVVRNSDKPETAHWAIGFRVVRGPGTIW